MRDGPVRFAARPWLSAVVGWSQESPESAIHVTAVPDTDDRDEQFAIDDLIENAVVALTQPVLLLATQLFATEWPWIARQAFDLCDGAATVFWWERFDFLGG